MAEPENLYQFPLQSRDSAAAGFRINSTLDEDPDEAGRASQLGRMTGVNPGAIYGDSKKFQQAQRNKFGVIIAGQDPDIMAYINNEDINAKISADDWHNLYKLSSTLDRWGVPKRISRTATIVPEAADAFVRGFGEHPWGGFIDPEIANMKPFGLSAYAAWYLLGLPFDIMAKGFHGVLEGVKAGAKEYYMSALGIPLDVFKKAMDAGWRAEPEMAPGGFMDIGGVKAAVQAGAAALYKEFGEPDESEATNFAREFTALTEARLQGFHPHKAPVSAYGAYMHRVWEVEQAARPFLKKGATIDDIPSGVHPVIDSIKAWKAKADAEIIDAARRDAFATKTHERDAHVVAEDFLPLKVGDENIWVDAEAVHRLYAGKEPTPDDGILGWVPDIVQQLRETEEVGGNIEVPLKGWIALTSDEAYKALRDDMRLRPNGESLREAKEREPINEQDPLDIAHSAPSDDPGQEAINAVEHLSGMPRLRPQVAQFGPGESFRVAGDIRIYQAEETSTVRDALAGTDLEAGVLRDYHAWIRAAINKYAGDTKIHVVGDQDYLKAAKQAGISGASPAFYSSLFNQILIPRSRFDRHPKMNRVILHEAVHAATSRILQSRPELEARVDKLRAEAQKMAGVYYGQMYGFKNTHEFLSETFSNPAFQLVLGKMRISEALATELGVTRRVTVMEAIKQFIAKVFGAEPGQINALSAAIQLGFETSQTEIGPKMKAFWKNVESKGFIPRDLTHEAPRQLELDVTRMSDKEIVDRGKSMGITEVQYRRLLNKWKAKREKDRAAQLARKEAQIKRETSEQWKEAKPEVRKEVEAELDDKPDMAIMFAFRSGTLGGEKLPGRMVFDRDKLTNLQRMALPERYFRPGGMDPLDVANLFGFKTVDEAVLSLKETHEEMGKLGPKEYWEKSVQDEVNRRLEKRFGPTRDELLSDAVNHVLSDETFDLLHEDILRYATEAGQSFELSLADMKEQARLRFNDANAEKATAVKYLTFAGKIGKKVEEALAKQDWKTALKLGVRQQQIALIAKEAAKFEIEKRKFQRLLRGLKREFPKDMDPAAVPWIQMTLLKAGIESRNNKAQLDEGIARSQWSSFDDMTKFYEGFRGQEMGFADYIKRWDHGEVKNMSVEDYRDFHEAMDLLSKGTRSYSRIAIWRDEAGNLHEIPLEDARQQAIDNLNKLPELTPEQQKKKAYRLDAYQTRTEEMVKDMDLRQDLGILWRVFTHMLEDSKGRRFDMQEKLVNMLKSTTHGFDWQRSLSDTIDNTFIMDAYSTGPKVLFEMKRSNMINVALNWGNRGNKEKFVLGTYFDIALDKKGRPDKAEVQQTIDKVDAWLKQNMRKEDWDYVQKMWDIHAWLKEPTGALYTRLTGRPPKWVPAEEVATPHGTYAGGYYPIIEDRTRSMRGVRVSENKPNEVLGTFGQNYFRATTSNARTKERTKYRTTLDITDGMGGNMSRVMQAIHDITYREAIININKIFDDDSIMKHMNNHYGSIYVQKLRRMVDQVANEYGHDEVIDKFTEQIFRTARQKLTTAALGFNWKLQITPDVATGTALWRWANDLVWFSKTRAQNLDIINRYSNEVPYTMQQIHMEMNKLWNLGVRQHLWAGTKKQVAANVYMRMQETAMKWGFYVIGKTSQELRGATFMSFYNKAIREGKNPEEAGAIADSYVRERHGTTALQDLPEVMRSRESMRQLTLFLGFNLTMSNWARQIPGLYRRGEYSKLLATVWGSTVLPGIMSAYAYNKMKENDSWWAQMAWGIGMQGVQQLAWMGRGAYNVMFEGQKATDALTSIISTVHDALWRDGWEHWWRDHKEAKKWPKDFINLGGVLGIPGMTMQTARTAQAFYNINIAKRQYPKDFIEWYRAYFMSGETKLPKK